MEHVESEPLADVAYVYDGSLEGLFCAVFAQYERREIPRDIVTEEEYRPRLGQSAIAIETDPARAERVRAGIVRRGGRPAYHAVVRAAATPDPARGTVIARFVRVLMSRTLSPADARFLRCDYANPIAGDLHRLALACANEEEKMRQFIRFEHGACGIWFARCNPRCSVVPLIMPYFAGRFNTQPFIIYDEAHRIAGIWDTESWRLAAHVDLKEMARAADDARYQEAWKRFYRATSISARYHPELRRHFMPVRLWKNLTELAPTEDELDGRSKPAHGEIAADPAMPEPARRAHAPYDAVLPEAPSSGSTPVPSHAGMKLSSAAGPSCQK